MLVNFNRPQSKVRYVVTSDSSGYIEITDKMSVRLPEYMKGKVFVEPTLNETSSDI